MNRYKKYVAGLVVVTAFLPMLASADTISDLQAQIQTLLGQIKTIQDQIHSIRQASSTNSNASTTPIFGDDHGQGGGDNRDGDKKFCVPITRNLGVGSKGDDVKEIQKMLATDPTLYTGTTTGFFGKETAKAMARFQKKFGIASSTTGLVGPSTRQFFNKKCPPPPMGGVGSTTPPFQGGMGDGDRGRMMGSSTQPFPPMPPRGGDMMGGRGGDR